MALLRGVNVGDARTLQMRALEQAFRTAGATGVATASRAAVSLRIDRPNEACAAAGAAIEAEGRFRPPIRKAPNKVSGNAVKARGSWSKARGNQIQAKVFHKSRIFNYLRQNL